MSNMSGVVNLKPIAKGEHRGRQIGSMNRVTRAMKIAALNAAELSKHSDGTLTGYLQFLADEHPPCFANILTRLIPVQARIEATTAPLPRLDPSMKLDDMVSAFAEKLRSGYRVPHVIDHDDDGEQ
jgi:hypothetical protein